MRNFSKRMASLVFVQTVAASSLSSDNACLGVKTAYRSLQCCPSGAAAASLDGTLEAAKTGRDALAVVDVLPFKGKICVDSGAAAQTFNIDVGEAKAVNDFYKLPDGTGDINTLPTFPWLNGSKFYARKANCPAENVVHLWLQEEFSSVLPKPSLCDPPVEAFSKFTQTAYDMEYEANVRPNLVDGRLACYMFPNFSPAYQAKTPAYCSQPPTTKVSSPPSVLSVNAIRRFVAGTMAGPQISDPYSTQYLYFTTVEQGLAMMHASFAYAEAAKIYPHVTYPDKICSSYTGPQVNGCEYSGQNLPPIANGVQVCVYKDFAAGFSAPGPNEIAAQMFLMVMYACGANSVSPAAVLTAEMGVGRSTTAARK